MVWLDSQESSEKIFVIEEVKSIKINQLNLTDVVFFGSGCLPRSTFTIVLNLLFSAANSDEDRDG